MTNPALSYREPDSVIAEMKALNTAALALEQKADLRKAKVLVHGALRERVLEGVEDPAINLAMAKILNEDPLPFTARPSKNGAPHSWERFTYEIITKAWTEWVTGSPKRALEVLQIVRSQRFTLKRTRSQREIANLVALYFWAFALEHLVRGDLRSARRLWLRALEVGASFGTASHLAISWTYVASFFNPKSS